MANKWIESIIEDFISKKKFNGTLSDKQFQAFSNNMDRNTSNFYGRSSSSFTYEYKGYKFTLYSKNKFTLSNENNWEIEKREVEIVRSKHSLEIRTKRGLPKEELQELENLIKQLENEIIELRT